MAAALAYSPLAAAQPAPPLLPPGLVSGSAGAQPIDTGSAPAAIPLDLTPRYAPILPASIGSYTTMHEPATVPVVPADTELAPAPATPAEALGLDVGSVRAACTGSAEAGSAALALGSALGSGGGSGLVGPGLVGFGSSGSALGSSTGSGLVGPGSSGSALGSAAGSAFGSGALLTCLLLLPMAPPTPGIPLRLDPLTPVPIPHAPAEPVPARAQAPEPTPQALPARPPRAADPQPVEPAADTLAWNLLEIVTVLVIAVLTAVRTRVVAGRVPPLPR
ncbi:hypothetical protein [Nocardia sp. NPDC050793]|uniref:hypothetical protein n=1 Tax=Nocardia sp. NPDC050793 TaxID=3155159 RepID=UPI003406A200